VQDQQINKTHLQDLLKDKECCEGMIQYANVNSHASYYIVENLLSQVTGDGLQDLVNFHNSKLVNFKLQKIPTSGKESHHMNL